MAREIDDKKKRKALRKLRKAAKRAEAEGGPGLSDWEREFVDEVEERVEKYGSAFADPDKGALSEPLSQRQMQKLREIDKKSRGKGGMKRSSFKGKAKGKTFSPRSRDIHDDVEVDAENTERSTVSDGPRLVETPAAPPSEPKLSEKARPRPKLRLIKNEDDA
ncbi:MAG: hypothetical protein AAF292_02590 [Pseudomonadota bacterium]